MNFTHTKKLQLYVQTKQNVYVNNFPKTLIKEDIKIYNHITIIYTKLVLLTDLTFINLMKIMIVVVVGQ